MDEFGVSGFNGAAAVAKRRRSTTSRRPRLDSQPLVEGRDQSPPSTTPSSENASKNSTDGSSSHDTGVRRKEVNLNSLVPKTSSSRNEGATSSKRVKKDSSSYGDFDRFHSRDLQRPGPSGSNAPRGSEDVLAPASWKNSAVNREGPPLEDYVAGGNSNAESQTADQSEPAPGGMTENRVRKVKLKVGGVTRTIHAKSNGESSFEGGSSSSKPPRPTDASRHRQRLVLKVRELLQTLCFPNYHIPCLSTFLRLI